MKISECAVLMKEKTEKFFAENGMDAEKTPFAVNRKFDLLRFTDDSAKEFDTFDAILLGTFITDRNFLQFPYEPENPAIPDEDRDMYLTLQAFGKKVGVVELTETNISFDPMAVAFAHIHRRMEPSEVYRNQDGEIESVYALDDVIAIAGVFHNVKAIVPLHYDGYTIFLGVSTQ